MLLNLRGPRVGRTVDFRPFHILRVRRTRIERLADRLLAL